MTANVIAALILKAQSVARMEQVEEKLTTEKIWLELSTRLRQFILSRVNSPADADDILQTVFVRIHKNLDKLEQIERLESWVFQITRNAIIDYFRANSAQREKLSQIDLTSIPHTDETNEENNLNSVVAGCLNLIVQQLPEEQQRAVSLYELEGKSQKEIADLESISLSGAKSRIQRGRKNLAKILEDCCQLQIDSRGNVIDCEENQKCEC